MESPLRCSEHVVLAVLAVYWDIEGMGVDKNETVRGGVTKLIFLKNFVR